MLVTNKKGGIVQPNYRRNILPEPTVHVPLFVIPIQTKKEVRAFVSQVDCAKLPFVVDKYQIMDKWIYVQRTHNQATIVSSPCTLYEFMRRIQGMSMLN